jgi:DNA-directed RNA polymerase subunit F
MEQEQITIEEVYHKLSKIEKQAENLTKRLRRVVKSCNVESL